MEASLEHRALAAWPKRRLLPRQAAQKLLAASEAMTLVGLAALARIREVGGNARLLAENKHLQIRNARLLSENRILHSRLEGISPRRRPHYAPATRFQILEHMKAHLLSIEETAGCFLVSPQTLYNWLRELKRHPEGKSIGSLLRIVPPLRRYADVVRRLAHQMKSFGFGGNRQIALTLSSFGWTPSRRSVGRFCQDDPLPEPEGPERKGRSQSTTVLGRYPNHLWLADVTCIPTLFPFLHLHLHLTVVLDAFSRTPLKAALSYFEPSACSMLNLVQKAIHFHGRPRHFVSDRGSQFTADAFRVALRIAGIQQRFGALYQHGSIALIERFFQTLKSDLRVHEHKPWNLDDFKRRLIPALVR